MVVWLILSLTMSLVTVDAPARAQTTIRLDELPSPPPELKQLMDAGSVTFRVGTPEDQREPKEGLGEQTTSTARPVQKFAAQTHFQIRFDFDAQIAWRVIERLAELRITAKLRRFEWQPSHTVWFRDRPATEDFWSNSLVLHEFDHISLSTDPRMRARFDQLKKKPLVIRRPLSSGEVIDQKLIDRVVEQHLLSMHQEALELIEIRYRELDLQTAHGREPIGQDSPLKEQLREIRSAISQR